MQYPAQVASAIELLYDIDTLNHPADRIMAHYFKGNRYIGSSDKGVIADIVYGVQRYASSLVYLAKKAGLNSNERGVVITYLQKYENKTKAELKEIFSGKGYAPNPLEKHEIEAIDYLAKEKNHLLKDAPLDIQLNIPAWLLEDLEEAYGDTLFDEMKAANRRAPADIRTNTLITNKGELKRVLLDNGFNVTETEYAPNGLRMPERKSVFGMEIFKNGWMEIQDEGSQLLALLCNAQKGQKVVDYCAGAGGKTLAIAEQMENKGTIYACDIHSKRLDELKKRCKRAKVHNVRTQLLEGDRWHKKQAKSADIVFVDAPCTGTGTWRRNPDMKWKLTKENLANLVETQQEVLKKASNLTKIGGKFIYATCSILPAENAKQIDKFLIHNPNFKVVPISDAWPKCITKKPITSGNYMQLTPHQHNTDGFFAAVLVRES